MSDGDPVNDGSLSWMYQQNTDNGIQSAEDYLLGKVYKTKDNKLNGGSDRFKSNSDSSSKWMNKITSKNDTFLRVHEDPVLAILQEQKKQREVLINNPIKMNKIKQKIALELNEKESEKQKKKEKKKEKKEMKKLKKKRKREEREREKKNRDDDSSSSSSSSSEDSDDNNKKKKSSRSDNNNREPKDPRYGLINKDKSSIDVNNLGPNKELLEIKKEKEKRQIEERMKNKSNNVKNMTEEERLKRIKEMEQDAEANEIIRLNRQLSSLKSNRNDDNTGNAAFLDKMRTDAYKQSYTNGIEDRLSQNKFYSQKGSDLDSSGFMKK